MEGKVLTILCSGVALGVYIPAMLVNYQLRQQGINTEVIVLENLIIEEKKNKINENKKAFHNNFSVALVGQKISKDIRPSIDQKLLLEMFDKWEKENRKDFIIFSGFWISIIEDYKKTKSINNVKIDAVHMDADISASWKNYKDIISNYNNIWLFSNEQKKLIYEIPVTNLKPIPYSERPERFLIHGGGWGMGTYQSKIPELEKRGFKLDIIAYDISEISNEKNENRYFMVNPNWSPWHKNSKNEHEFPQFAEIKQGQVPEFKNKEEYHELFDVIRDCKAIISKPGGATLLDSLASATPIIMLDPFGDYENENSELWEYLGFGISYGKWVESGYSTGILEELHNNLLNGRYKLINYAEDYVNRNKDLIFSNMMAGEVV